MNAALSCFNQILSKRDYTQPDDTPIKQQILYRTRIREDVSMMWIYGKDDARSAAEARRWFTSLGIPATKKEDPGLRKYMVEVAAEKLQGINLMDVMIEEKKDEMVEKVPLISKHIVSFIKATVENGKNGTNHEMRNMSTRPRMDPVPLDQFGLKSP